MKEIPDNRKSEYGGTGVKLAAVLAVLFLVAYAGINYIPIAYEGQNFKQEMQTAVVQGMASPGGMTSSEMVKGKIQRAMQSNNIPTDAIIQVKPFNGSIQAHVAYTKNVSILPFGIYNYNYNFDHTATPTGFLMKDN